MTDPARSVGHHFDTWAPSYDAQIPDTAAEHLSWLTAAGFAAVDVVWKYDDVGVLVAWREERST